MTLVIAGMVLFSQASFGAVVRISWNSNGESDLDGYKVYYGTGSRTYQNTLDVGTFTTAEISNLGEGLTYYFAVTAYDTNGNESGFSSEVTVAIPESTPPTQEQPAEPGDTGTTPDPVDPGMVPQADTDKDGIPDNVELLWGMDANDPFDSLLDLDGDGVVNLVEYMAGTDPLDPTNRPTSEDVLKDVIGEVGEPIDLSEINPTGEYTFVPLMTSQPEVVDDSVVMADPGAYLYNVYDAQGALVYRVRISVATTIFASGSFVPGAPMSLDELTYGISLSLKANAGLRSFPIGIGSMDAVASSSVNYSESDAIEFELLPYGLALAEPASISVEADCSTATVQRYNEESDAWVTIANVSSENGLVKFSTQQLGKFRILTEETASDTADDSGGGGGGGGGGCFISTAGR